MYIYNHYMLRPEIDSNRMSIVYYNSSYAKIKQKFPTVKLVILRNHNGRTLELYQQAEIRNEYIHS